MRTAENLRDTLRLADVFRALYPGFRYPYFRGAIAAKVRGQMHHYAGTADHEAAAAHRRLWYEVTTPRSRMRCRFTDLARRAGLA